MREIDLGTRENDAGTVARAIGRDSLGNYGGTEFRADRRRGDSLYFADRRYFDTREDAEAWRDEIEVAA